MSEVDLELLITMDDPGEDTLEADAFHLRTDNTIAASVGHSATPAAVMIPRNTD